MKTCPRCNMRYPNEAEFCFLDNSELQALADERIGTLISGRYVLEAVVGEGGMATVYRARLQTGERQVAVKVLHTLIASDPTVRERFRREANSARKLSHPNIIEIFDEGETTDGSAFIAMELLEGRSLGQIVAPGAMDLGRAMTLMIQIARGIARAHDFEVIHRDLKPDNIFVVRRDDQSEIIKLLDFGIARSKMDGRLTGRNELVGTPEYLSPERINGEDGGPASDLYSLGVILYEMMTGTTPFSDKSTSALFLRHLNEPAADPVRLNPRIPPRLSKLVLDLLSKDPAQRPADAHRVHQELLEIAAARELPVPRGIEEEPESIRPGTRSERMAQSAAASAQATAVTERWLTRALVMQRIVDRAFPGAADGSTSMPEEVDLAFRELQDKSSEVTELRRVSLTLQEKLEEVELRGRETRQRLGFAVDALGADVSRVRDEGRVSRTLLAIASERSAGLTTRFAEAHREITFWEGRTGFMEPHADLAAAYRAAANVLDEWRAAKDDENLTRATAEGHDRAALDLVFQLTELRAALSGHEDATARERSRYEVQIAQAGREIETLESELLARTTQICEPLRNRSDLADLFRALEEDRTAVPPPPASASTAEGIGPGLLADALHDHVDAAGSSAPTNAGSPRNTDGEVTQIGRTDGDVTGIGGFEAED